MARWPAYPEVAHRAWSTKGVLRNAPPESGGLCGCVTADPDG